MTNLSKELCEICGIERKGKLIFRKRDWDGRCWISAGRGYKEFDFTSIPEVTVDIIPTKDYKETNGFQYPYTDIEKIKKIYNEHGYDFVEFKQNVIDFTQPDNFVKLWELKIKHPQTLEMLSLNEYLKYSNRKSFLTSMIVRLQTWDSSLTNEYQKVWLRELKQAIRKAEWVYE